MLTIDASRLLNELLDVLDLQLTLMILFGFQWITGTRIAAVLNVVLVGSFPWSELGLTNNECVYKSIVLVMRQILNPPTLIIEARCIHQIV